MRFFIVITALVFLVWGCDDSTSKKPGPDTGANDADQTATGDQLMNDDGQLVNDDGEPVNDDGEPVGDDGTVNDDIFTDEEPDSPSPDEDMPPNACYENGDCDEAYFCAKPEGTCEEPFFAGSCERRPTEEECMAFSAIIEVCGCDGKTYQHPCFAQAAGVNIAYKGKCGSVVVTCETNEECGDFVAMLCQKDTGVCDNGIGVCVIPQTGCPEVYAPVCGCDGVTYGNECEAHANFMNVASEGECGGQNNYSTLYYYYEANSMEQPDAKVVIVTGDGTVTFDGAELVTREAVNQYVYLRTTFYGAEGGGVVNLQLRLNAGSSIPATTTLDGTNSYAQWTNFYGGGPEVLIGNLYGDITVSQYNRNNNTITLIEMSGEKLTFVPN